MKRITATAALLALAASPALAKPDKAEKPPKAEKPAKAEKAKQVTAKGVVVANDGTTLTVDVTKANKAGRFLIDAGDVAFTTTKVSVADFNGDGVANLSDVQVGDKVVVQAKLAKDAVGPYAARKVVDQTNAPADDAETEETEAPAPVVPPVV